MDRQAFDIVVAGAGPVSLAFAASLAPSGLTVALVDPQGEAALANPAEDGREIALSARSAGILRALGAWDHIPPGRIAPLRRMRVLNGPSDYAMLLGSDPAEKAEDGLLGRFVPNAVLRRALHTVVRTLPHVTLLPGTAVKSVQVRPARAEATLSDGRVLAAALVIAADTRTSALRRQQGIGAALHDYHQRMIACPVAHELAHDETATAWFEYGQTLVTLPLNGQCSSAVMTVSEPDAATLLRLDDDAFARALDRRYRNRLGPMRPLGPRHAVPVVTAYAHRFAAPRFALLGDAAVGMHPTTARGYNFGLLGQHALADEITRATAAGHDPGHPGALSRYQSRHRSETGLFFAGAEAIMRLYAAGDSLPARMLRNTALRVGNLGPLRQALSAAAG